MTLTFNTHIPLYIQLYVCSYELSGHCLQLFLKNPPEVIFQGCLRDFILCFLKSTDEAVSENVYIGYNILYYGIYFY